MRRSILALALLVVLSLSARTAWAWSGAGHMLIAAEAFRELSPDLKFNAAKILESHPDYEKWRKSFGAGRGDVDLQTYIFMRASAWPDEIHKNESQFAHPRWHYIDYPLRPPTFPDEPAPLPEDNLLYGIEQCHKVLADTNSTPELKAVHLSYLIHLVGDLHQPLHCASLFNDTYPKGDRGGTDFYVKVGTKPITLHAFWDELLGTRLNVPTLFHTGIQFTSETPTNALLELKKNQTPKDWSLEGRTLAIHKVYLLGELKGSTRPEAAPMLPKDYIKNAKEAAEKQAVLATFRLVEEIKKCFPAK